MKIGLSNKYLVKFVNIKLWGIHFKAGFSSFLRNASIAALLIGALESPKVVLAIFFARVSLMNGMDILLVVLQSKSPQNKHKITQILRATIPEMNGSEGLVTRPMRAQVYFYKTNSEKRSQVEVYSLSELKVWFRARSIEALVEENIDLINQKSLWSFGLCTTIGIERLVSHTPFDQLSRTEGG